MSAPAVRAVAGESTAERRQIILDAAERSFTRAGFHRSTMQDVAVEAGMSPGNLYRYFASKAALVAGLCERDRVGLATEFRAMHQSGGDFMAAFRALGQRHFADSPENLAKAKLCLEIWSEAARNPEIAALQTEFDQSFEQELTAAFEVAKGSGAIHPDVDVRAVASIISKLGDGLFVRRAVAADFNPEREIGEVFALVAALLQGAVRLSGAASDLESKP